MNRFVAFIFFGWTIGSAQIINFPDANFKNVLLMANATNGIACMGSSMNGCLPSVLDANGNGEIELSEAQSVALLSIPGGSNISDLTGIEYFTNLERLQCPFNHLTSIDVSQLIHLLWLQLRNNQITSLDLSNLTQLNRLDCQSNQLSSIDVNHQPGLEIFIASNNQISSFDFSANTALQRAYCDGNLMTSLDFSTNPNFFDLGCRNSPNLTSIKIKNGMTQLFGSGTFYNQCWNNVPNLGYICADSNEIPALQSFLAGCGVTQTIIIDSACPLSVAQFSKESFVVSPNPSIGVFRLSCNQTVSQSAVFSVYDVLGKMILEREIVSGFAVEKIDLEGYPKGIYFLRITIGEVVINKKLIKE